MDEKQDAIDRKAAIVERIFTTLFAAVKDNQLAAMLVVSVGLNFYLLHLYTKVQQDRLDDSTVSKKELVEEVRRRVDSELPEQLAPYRDQQENNTKKLDTSLINLNGTVESVKKYFNKKKNK